MELELNSFEQAIKDFLDNLAKEDATFAVTYAKENKSIKECYDYIYGEVSKAHKGNAKCVAMSDEAVFGLAIHYYDEDDVKPAEHAPMASVVHSSSTAEANAEKPKTRKTRQPKSDKRSADIKVDENIPEPFDMPLF